MWELIKKGCKLQSTNTYTMMWMWTAASKISMKWMNELRNEWRWKGVKRRECVNEFLCCEKNLLPIKPTNTSFLFYRYFGRVFGTSSLRKLKYFRDQTPHFPLRLPLLIPFLFCVVHSRGRLIVQYTHSFASNYVFLIYPRLY